MSFRLEHGSYRPHFASNQNQTKAITDCPGCNASLNLMVAHLERNDARYVLAAALGESGSPFLLPAVVTAADDVL
jgi:hypothetical protein